MEPIGSHPKLLAWGTLKMMRLFRGGLALRVGTRFLRSLSLGAGSGSGNSLRGLRNLAARPPTRVRHRERGIATEGQVPGRAGRVDDRGSSGRPGKRFSSSRFVAISAGPRVVAFVPDESRGNVDD